MLISMIGRIVGLPHFVLNHNLQMLRYRLSGSRKEAVEKSTGGDYEYVGRAERQVVVENGLQQNHYLIDVGCGPGRLANQLKDWSELRYLGTDVVPASLKHAAEMCSRPDWRFTRVASLTIPEKDNAADFVTFFSVFTHLLHEESYAYLQEAKRVLKPGGRIIFSFLDFTIAPHWSVFEGNVRRVSRSFKSLNVFIDKAALPIWAQHLDLELVAIHGGDERFPQSVCVMKKLALSSSRKTGLAQG